MAKILIVVPVIAQEGISSVVIPQINEFVRRNLDVTLVVLSRVEAVNQKIDLPPANIIELCSAETFLSIKAVFNSLHQVSQLISILKQLKVGVVMAHGPYAHFIARLAKIGTIGSKLNFRLLQYFHSPQYKLFPNNTIRRKVFNYVIAKLAAKADDVHISVSESVKEDIELHLVRVKKHEVVYNAVPPFEGELVNPDSATVENYFAGAAYKVLLPGRLDVNKGQSFFLDVFNDFIRENSSGHFDVMLLIVGDGFIKDELAHKVGALHLQEQVLLTSGLPHATLIRLMKQADLVVVPSFIEGMPMVVLEALKVKKMVLASETGGIPEVITHGETGFLFKTGDKQACLKMLQHIYDSRNAELIDRTSLDNLLQTKFSFEEHITQLLRIIGNQ